jgi:hypothetical protein
MSSGFACIDAMREEYKAIIDGGGPCSDDPSIAENWDNQEPRVEAYRPFAMRGVEALDHATGGLLERPLAVPPMLR